jgi:DNA-binding SARP family transcriptional activator
LLRRAHLEREVLGALHHVAECHAARGEYDLMEQAARRQLGIDPLLEAAHRQVMCALAWRGERRTALAQYLECCRILDRELGVRPETSTIELHAQIEAGRLRPPHTNPELAMPAFN